MRFAPRSTIWNCYRPSGTNGVLSTSDSSYLKAYGTTTGWDFATEIGTVNATNLVRQAGSVVGRSLLRNPQLARYSISSTTRILSSVRLHSSRRLL